MGVKDISEKILTDYNDVFADIANVLLFQGEQMISPDSLRNERTVSQYKSSSNKLHEQERDILKPWTDGNLKITLIGFENQTNPDKYMPVRIFGYIPNDKRTIKHVDEVLKLLSVMSGDDRYEKILSFSNEK